MPTHVNDSLSEGDIIRELEAATRAAEEETNEQYYTTRELVALTGWRKDSVLQALRKLKDDGRLDVRKKRCENLAGKYYHAPAYRILPGE